MSNAIGGPVWLERGDRYIPQGELVERLVGEPLRGIPVSTPKYTSRRRAWLKWVKKLIDTATFVHRQTWSHSAFEKTTAVDEFEKVLSKFCKGHVRGPGEKKSKLEGRFDAMFEVVGIPPSPPAQYPTGLAYTAVPVGSMRGVGVSTSASQCVSQDDPSRFQNYVDGPTIRSRKRGNGGSVRIGGGMVVQRKGRP